jgi:hypothetical protein
MSTNGDAFAKQVATNNEMRLDNVHSVDCVNEFLPIFKTRFKTRLGSIFVAKGAMGAMGHQPRSISMLCASTMEICIVSTAMIKNTSKLMDVCDI